MELATHPEVVAIGECGLDYFRDLSPRSEQRRAFERQLSLASAMGKPVFLHQRDAHDDFHIHFHLLALDGVYVRVKDRLEFRRVPPPRKAELDELLATITRRVGRHLQRRGWLTRDAQSSQLNLDREDTALDSLLGHSITYRIALGPRAGQKAFTLRSLPGTLLRIVWPID